MKPLIKALNKEGYKTKACCCGHGKYPMTIVMWHPNLYYFDFISGKIIHREKRFYTRDKQGYYYIKEVIKCKKK